MDRSSQGLLLSQAVNGFVKYKVVEGLSDTTLTSYQDQLDRLLYLLGDILIAGFLGIRFQHPALTGCSWLVGVTSK
jgi:site-specific recombinase XerC